MGRRDMRGQEIRSRCEDPKGFNRTNIAVLKMDKPTRNVGVRYSGDYFF